MVAYSSILVVLVYLAFTIFISYLVNKRSSNRGDFSTGGKQFGWLTVGISILATYISAMTFVGMPGWVYSDGMQAIAIHLNYPIVIFFSVVFFIPIFYKLGLTSIYEYLEHRFGVITRTINSLVFIVVQCIASGIILYAVSLILVRILPISVEEAIIYISLFTALYTYAGGISTVIWTDVMQSGFLLAGCIAVFATLVMNLPDLGALPELSQAVETKLSMANLSTSFGDDTTLMAGLIAVSFLHLSVYGSNQLIIQRTLATRSVKTAQKSMLVCGYGAFFIYLFFSLMGVLLFVFYQGQPFENSNDVILDFVFNHTHPLIVGLIMAALSAAAMSTLDSSYNSMATVATFDIYKRFIKPDHDNAHYEKVARRLSLSCAVLVVIPAMLAISNESVLKSIASLTSIFVGIRLGSFLLGIFSRSSNEAGIIAASITSILAILVCQSAGVAWPWYAPAGTVVFIATGLIVSQVKGQTTASQLAFFEQQKSLYTAPTTSQYMLLVFAAFTVLACFFLPNLLAEAIF
ncbi:sodium:solute symporter family transporter [Photobacterium rosenbergii]|uniref:sodium:solute symporter family transporter n=1 Tax=Photobacterium rosenbergii TaxID=294936 RepID=UPI001C98FE6E|nr:sodium/solute symporter [Photobacterium rosenbergii]MBY5946745.1 sodium/solute symporter [Photobacterium rosenbergii]